MDADRGELIARSHDVAVPEKELPAERPAGVAHGKVLPGEALRLKEGNGESVAHRERRGGA